MIRSNPSNPLWRPFVKNLNCDLKCRKLIHEKLDAILMNQSPQKKKLPVISGLNSYNISNKKEKGSFLFDSLPIM